MTAADPTSRRQAQRARSRRVAPVLARTVGCAALVLLLTSSASERAAASSSAAPGSGLALPKAVGQLVISTYAGPSVPASILRAVRTGQTGAVILMGDDTSGGVRATRRAVDELQAAARTGHNPGLLVMTDQEGGEVKRLPGPPAYAASRMSNARLAGEQGRATGRMLRQAGVNVDLAPVADVSRIDGFMTREHRTFGSRPSVVAAAACAFARGLQAEGVGYTLKHFPGLGDAVNSTDEEPVRITEPAREIAADGAAYRECGSSPYASVMVSSASYEHLTGNTPAVLSPAIYQRVMPGDDIDAVTMSDSFQSGAIDGLHDPALTAVAAGLDMVMYPGDEAGGAAAYRELLAAAQHGRLSPERVQAAATRVLELKRTLGLLSAGSG